MSRRVVTRRALWLAGLALATAFGQAGAQDAQEQVDSTRIRIRERLERLARPPGFDSVLYVQDSLRAAEALAGRRPGAGAAGDTVAAALLRMPGFTLTEYDAGSATFEAEDRVLLLIAPEEGQATVTREGLEVAADTSILFDESSGLMRTTGNSIFTPPEGDPVESVTMVYDVGEARGSATGAKTTFREGGAIWQVTGDMPFAAPDSTFMSHAHFTSCEIEEPHYHFEANEIKIVGGDVLVARGVRLYFADVPVFWLPFMAQSLAQGRSSGLLTPRFSVNDIVRTSGGYRRRVSNMGFYWAMSDYSDALVALDWFSDNFLSLTGSARYRFSRQFLDGSLNLRRYWRQDGSNELALDTRHQWEFDERTQLRVSGRYASSNDFVRENSFNPAEVTQSIDSEGGINRRFGWGSLALGANRKQYLSDDRTEWTLPSANLSLSTITLLPAPPNRARFYNNLTWSGSSNFSRRTLERIQPDTFSFSQANTANTSGAIRTSLSLGNLSISQNLQIREEATLGVPEALLLVGDSIAPMTVLTGAPARDIAESDLMWSSSIDYQQQLVGSTTITPRLSLSGSMFKADTSSLAPSFVSALSRIAFGATLKTDLYGMGGGFGPFEAVRHKFSPSIQYEWSPSTTPTELQQQVFRSRALQPKNAVSITLNQTWEAKRRQEEGDSAAVPAPLDPLDLTTDSGVESDGPRSVQSIPPVTLLALRTSVVRYDFVEADSIGSFLSGFQTTRLSNQISSDFLRGLSVSVDHELFEDTQVDGELQRAFAPHLSQVNFSFSLGSSSSLFRWLRSLTGGTDIDEPVAEPEAVDPFLGTGPTDESSIIPGVGLQTGREPGQTAPRARGSGGGWNANLSYSLQRPRDDRMPASQMLTGTVTMRPTESWDVSWRTAYDIERGAFNDHTIRLTRDLHRWQVNFDFLQTATGNWTFRFEVSLLDNRDLKFDYKQRNLDAGFPQSRRR